MKNYAPFPLIDLSGSPRERGRTHGQAAADRLRRGAKMYAESLLKSGVDWAELERRAEALVPSIEKFDPTYIEEMRGIAEGANEPFGAVMLMNARTEMVSSACRAFCPSPAASSSSASRVNARTVPTPEGISPAIDSR